MTRVRDISTMPHHAGDHSYNRALATLKKRSLNQLTPQAVDDDSPGAKELHFNLGLCDEKIEESIDGVYFRDHHVCPHDKRYFETDGQRTKTALGKGTGGGCFHTCHIFKGKRNRENSMRMIHKRIEVINYIPIKMVAE